MKKSIIIIALVSLLGACNSNIKTSTKEDVSDSTSQSANKKSAYACPMDCEKGKTYDKAGTCPVCGMDLEKK